MKDEKTPKPTSDSEVGVEKLVIKFGGANNLANFITVAGWLIVIMFFVITNAFRVMFEASMLFIAIVGGLAWLGIAIIILLGIYNLMRWVFGKLTAKSL